MEECIEEELCECSNDNSYLFPFLIALIPLGAAIYFWYKKSELEKRLKESKENDGIQKDSTPNQNAVQPSNAKSTTNTEKQQKPLEKQQTANQLKSTQAQANTYPEDSKKSSASPGFSQAESGYLTANSNQFSNQSPNQFSKQSPNQFSKQSPNQFSNQSPNQFSKQSPNQFSKQSPNQLSNQSPNQLSNQSPNQFSNQSLNQFSNQTSRSKNRDKIRELKLSDNELESPSVNCGPWDVTLKCSSDSKLDTNMPKSRKGRGQYDENASNLNSNKNCSKNDSNKSSSSKTKDFSTIGAFAVMFKDTNCKMLEVMDTVLSLQQQVENIQTVNNNMSNRLMLLESNLPTNECEPERRSYLPVDCKPEIPKRKNYSANSKNRRPSSWDRKESTRYLQGCKKSGNCNCQSHSK